MPVEPLRGVFGPDPRPVATGIDRVLRGLGRPTVDTTRRIVDATLVALGPELAGQVLSVDVADGAIVLQVGSAAVASEVRWHTATVIEHLNDVIGADAPSMVTVRVVRGQASRGG